MSVDRVVLPLKVRPVHYKLELVPDLVACKFSAVEDINVLVSEVTNEVTLHCKEIFVKEASFTTKTDAKSPALAEISYKLAEKTVTFRFEDVLPLGDAVLHIEFDGILNGDMAGFYKSSYTDADGNKQTMANTQFEALDARRAFPCWDEPEVKATFEVSLVVPSELTAISNMPEISTQHLPGNRKRVVFGVSPKMSTYLLAWAVGQFDYVQADTKNGVTIRVFSPPGRAEHGRFALDVGLRALDFYDEYFGVPYPLPKLDMICCTEFAMGAMENWGLVTYREVDLMIDEAKASSQQKQRVAIVVAHELAHQWFGNLVTMKWWDDIWLNEGFAAYMEHFAVDALFPDYKIWEQYTTDAMGAALRLDSLRTSHPIQVPIKHAEEVEQVFDAISYCKGSTVVRMAACVLGAEKFREGLQKYMKTFQYSNTITTDLWGKWSEVSGLDIPNMMASWTQQMGHPYLSVVSESWSATSVTFTLEQNWFLADGSGTASEEDRSKKWTIPLVFATSSSVSARAILMTEKQQTFTVPLTGNDDWIKLNAGQQALVRVAHSSEMTRRLQAAIRSKSLSPIDRASLLLDGYAIAKAGGPLEDIVSLLRAYDEEDSDAVWVAIDAALRGLNNMMEVIGGDAFVAFKKFGASIVKKGLTHVGWDVRPTDGHTEKLFRSTVIGLLEVFCGTDEDVVAECRRRFEEHWENPAVLSSDIKSIVFRVVLKNGGETEYNKILNFFNTTNDNAERKFVLNSLGAAPSKALKLRTMDWAAKSGEVKLQDFFYPFGVVGSSVEGVQLTWDYFKENVVFLKSKLAKASPSLMDALIINCVARFSTVEKAQEIEAYFQANPMPSSSRKVSQIVESIRNTGTMLNRVRESNLAKASFW